MLAPDVLIIQDATLLHQVDVFQGLPPDGYVLINSKRSFDELGLAEIAQRFRHERLVHRAGDRDRAQARRAGRCPTPCCSAASPRSPA